MKGNISFLQEHTGNTPPGEQDTWVLVLFVAGATGNSLRALANIKNICEQYLKGHYRLDVVDIYQDPEIVQKEQIIAIPTLLLKNPIQEIRLVGDMSETEKVLKILGLP
jgi:circadian clock protein KaiB